ncbi:hypothetical protein DICPUDRAFT_32822 [Dictyostelium purpureum]|uniref:Uncharacterized protein n=1 Tax=Dictyostelium purpureum TaxID=5786 RepID=F0ZJU1_DICPU|nr:uncharacterized protein DICPUDRAFT_32822 [Dictyostelium purpureum]EGC35784.1 hypothetical protein DICPUDRAFT_32822 [Dictyostelium purpureum]|eukprot:XP_003287678.1 hypothetical protein DICPUDRAFT_32822 [Dictyostelium purpureum]
MKLLSLILFITVLINFANANSYLTIIPKGSDSCGETYGVGYYLPMGTCISVNDWNLSINQVNGSHIQISYLGPNCSSDSPINYAYAINECVNFQFLDSPYTFSSIFSISDSVPTDAVVYNYYYYSYYCSGPTYSIFFTNGFSNNFSKFMCVDKKPEVFLCSGTGDCTQIDTDGCTNGKGVDMPYRVTCN